MANVLGEAWVEISAPLTRLGRDLGRAQGMVDRSAGVMGSRMGRLGSALSGIGSKMMLGVTLPIIGYMGVAVKAAMEAEKATAELNAALKLQGVYSEATSKRLEQYASGLMKITVYDDELIRSTMAAGLNIGITSDKIEEATKAAMGLAAKYRLDFSTAMTLVGKAVKGNTGLLGRYGIVLDESMTKEEKFAKVLELGAQGFPLVTAYAKTTEGQLLQLNNAMGELNQSIGDGLIPNLNKMIKALNKIVDYIEKMPKATRAWGIGGAAAMAPTLIALGQVLMMYKQIQLARAATTLAGAAGGGAGAVKALAPAAIGLGAKVGIATGVGMMGYGAYGMLKGGKGSWAKTQARAARDFPQVAPAGSLGKGSSPFTAGSTLDLAWQRKHTARLDTTGGPLLSPKPGGEGSSITKKQGDEIIKKLGNIEKKTGTWG